MTTYQYRCDRDGVVETPLPMGTAPPELACPACGRDARRVFSAPLLGLADRRAMSLIDTTERTSEVPDVVTSLPPGHRPRTVPRGPSSAALRRLPRP